MASSWRPAIAVTVALLVLASPVAAQGFDRDLRSVRIDDNTSLQVTVVNPLPVDDLMTVTFTGPAVEEARVMELFYPPECLTGGPAEQCRVTVASNGTRTLNLTVQGTSIGQRTMVGTVNSSTTQLSSSDEIEIRVQGLFDPVTVSAPGLTPSYLLLLLAAVAVIVWRRPRAVTG